MTTLLTVLGHPEPTRRARRDLAYDALVAFVDDPDSEALERLREMEALAGCEVEVVPVDPSDPVGTLRTMVEAVGERPGDLAFQVNARDNRLTHPAILCCFQTGTTAWFCTLEGSRRLPVVEGVEVVSRFRPAERRTLARLPDEARREALVEAADDPRSTVLDALLDLEGKGLVEVEGDRIRVTDAGRYYREGVRAASGPPEPLAGADPEARPR